MKYLVLYLSLLGFPAVASENTRRTDRAVNEHILPRFDALEAQTSYLVSVAQRDCTSDSSKLRDAFGSAFDAWVSVSHLRMGPLEIDDRWFRTRYLAGPA